MQAELQIVQDSVAAWVEASGGVTMLREIPDLGFDPARFAAMAALGWTGTLVPERHGGSDLGFRCMGVILEQLGRRLVPAPLVGSAVAACCALRWSGRHDDWLARIAEGSAIATIAIDETPRHAPERIAMRAERRGAAWVLNGTKTIVLDGMAAHLFIVAARTEAVTLFAVPATAPGVTRSPVRLIDSRGYATLSFHDVQLTDNDLLATPLDPVLDAARAALAAEMLGLAQQAFETTLDYLRLRVQFGKPIGAFQALQHRAAFMHGRLVLTRGLVGAALDALDAAPASAAAHVSAAKSAACDLVNLITREMMQMHGGIAMTEQHDAGLYLKRARVLEATLGSAAYHRDRFAALRSF